MWRIDLSSRLALFVRRWRSRWGISAPRVAVRTDWPWHWRALSVAVLSACSLALAGWVYDAGRQFAGFHQEVSAQELAGLQERIAQLETELQDARRIANSSDSRIRIESIAQDRLASQLRELEEENARLKADVAMFENLASDTSGPPGVVISRFQVVEDGQPGRYRYRLVVGQLGNTKDREFRGALRLVLTLNRGKETVMMELPEKGEGNPAQYALAFRVFGRFEGAFVVPAGTRVGRIEARIVEGGATLSTRTATLS